MGCEQELAEKYKEKICQHIDRYSQIIGSNQNYRVGPDRASIFTPIMARLRRDRAFVFVTDRGNKDAAMMLMDESKALERQLKLIVVPEYDSYVLRELYDTALRNGNYISDVPASSVYAEYFLLDALDHVLTSREHDDVNLVCHCSYKFLDLIKKSKYFERADGLKPSEMHRGIAGTYYKKVTLVKVPASRLPKHCSFILANSKAYMAPRAVQSYKVHTDPPGISGWLISGRVTYDAFITAGRSNEIFYCGYVEGK